MGKYINKTSNGEKLPAFDKAKILILDGAYEVDNSVFLKNMICVVENPMFDAAAYVFDEREFEYIKNNPDDRIKTWLVHPLANLLAE